MIAAQISSGARASLVYVLWIVAYIAYPIYYEGGPQGATPGKKICGIKVIDMNRGGPIGYGRAFIRLLMRIISGAVFYLGYLWMLWDKEKQCWHDKVANDVVVPADAYRSMSYEQAPQAPPGSYSSGPSGPRAGFWQRVGAAILDGLVLLVPSIILLVIFKQGALYQLLSTVMSLAYFTYFEGGPTGQTLGKRALGIRVYDFREGGSIGYGRGFLRQIGK